MHGDGSVGFTAVDDFSLQILEQGDEADCELLPPPQTTTAAATTPACREGDLKCQVKQELEKTSN